MAKPIPNTKWARLLEKRPRFVPSPPALGLKLVKKPKSQRFVGIDVKAALRELLNPTSEIPGHHDVLVAGLVAWLLRPNQQLYVANQMRIAAAEKIACLEAKFVKPGRNPAVATMLRLDPKHSPLFATLFYPMGGFRGLVLAYTSTRSADAAMRRAIKHVRHLVEVIKILHAEYSKCKIDGKGRVRISAEKANASILKPEHRTGPIKSGTTRTPKIKSDMLRIYWKHHARSLSFVYAASLLPWNLGARKALRFAPQTNPVTLLDALITYRVQFDDLKTILPTWAAYAEFVRKEILERTNMRRKKSDRSIEAKFPYAAFAFVDAKAPPNQ